VFVQCKIFIIIYAYVQVLLVKTQVVNDIGDNSSHHIPFANAGKPTEAKSSEADVRYTWVASSTNEVSSKAIGMVVEVVYALIARSAIVVSDSTARILVVVPFTMCRTDPAANLELDR
jgi:hypothetical protein